MLASSRQVATQLHPDLLDVIHVTPVSLWQSSTLIICLATGYAVTVCADLTARIMVISQATPMDSPVLISQTCDLRVRAPTLGSSALGVWYDPQREPLRPVPLPVLGRSREVNQYNFLFFVGGGGAVVFRLHQSASKQ